MQKLFERWRIADDLARTASRSLLDKLKLAMQNAGPPPSQEECDRVQELHRAAEELFQQGMRRLEQERQSFGGAPPSRGEGDSA